MKIVVDTISNREQQKNIYIVFLHVEKAFDRIWENGFIANLEVKGVM